MGMRINGASLRAHREREGVTQAALAKEGGVCRSLITNVEAGRRSLSAPVARRIAAALKLPLVAILVDPDEAPT